MNKRASINLHHGDCMEAMLKMEDNEYDLAIVDPPYGIGDFTNKTESIQRNVTKSKFEVKWNDNIPEVNYFNLVKKCSKKQIIWGANYYNCFSKNGGAIVWYKHTKHPNYSDCEIASRSFGVKVSYVDIEWYSLNRCEQTIHPCQKPVALYKWLLTNYAKPGDKILDTHGGSMSIAIACWDLKFDLDLWELDEDYYRAGKQRFEDYTNQLQFNFAEVKP